MTTAIQTTSPLTLTGELDPKLSRWLWLVKMFLAIPHFVVLTVLLVASLVTTVIAGFAILFTGRYPRALFDFNVGVLRWNWRVGFYVYAALGTDKYPPFTLARTDNPAELDVAYPEHLSRGLVLVKWLLAAPHIVIVALIVADLLIYPWGGSAGGYSILNLLVGIAGVFLLVTGRYPRSLFSFLIGINRWLYRVVIYVALMRDEYPPFRLDDRRAPGQSSDRGL
jgi:branched-subunit amino acid transport protein